MNRRLLVAAVVATVAIVAPVSAFAASGSVTSTPVNAALEYVQASGIMVGDGHGNLRPDDKITRQELVTMAMRRLYPNMDLSRCFEWIAPSLPVTYTKLFADVKITDVGADDLCGAMVAGLINGDKDGFFKPNNQVTFAEAAKIVSRAFTIYQVGRTDPPTMAWYVQYIDPMVEHHAIPVTILSPAQTVTRAEAAAMFYALRDQVAMPEIHTQAAAAFVQGLNAPKMTLQTPSLAAAPATVVAPPSRRTTVSSTLLKNALAHLSHTLKL